MPVYNYACRACAERFDALVRSDSPPPPCPACGAADAERLLSTFVAGSAAGPRSDFSRVPFDDASSCGGACGSHRH